MHVPRVWVAPAQATWPGSAQVAYVVGFLVMAAVGLMFIGLNWVMRGPVFGSPPAELPLTVHVEAGAWTVPTLRAMESWNQVAGGEVLKSVPSAESAALVIGESPYIYGEFLLDKPVASGSGIRLVFPTQGGISRVQLATRALGLVLGLPQDRQPSSVMNTRTTGPWRILPQDQIWVRNLYRQPRG